MRNLYRSTAAHNTIAIDGEEQNRINPVPGFAFCIGNQATVSPIEAVQLPSEIRMSASHNGYRHLGVEHRRSLRMEPRRISIEDTLSGSVDHLFEIFWHLPAEWYVEKLDSGEFSISGPIPVIMNVEGNVALICSYESTSISRTYGGVTEPGTVLKIAGSGRFPCAITTSISWDPEPACIS